MVAEKFLVIERPLEQGELEDVYRLPGLGDPAGKLTKVKSDMIPLRRVLESGACRQGILRPLQGVTSSEII